jgi:hypothetical protein
VSCFLNVPNGKSRLIERSEHADLIYQNKVRIENNYETYRRRQAIVEHPYGTIKRQWDFYYIMTKKTIKHASADVGLILLPTISNEFLISLTKTRSKSTSKY